MERNNSFVSLKLIRLTGLFYVLVIICAGFSQGYVRGTLVVPGDAIVNAENILQNKTLFRLGLTTDLIAFLLDVVISVLLFQIFKPFHKGLALISSSFRLIAHPAIGSINLLNHYMAMKVLDFNVLTGSFSIGQLQEMSGLLMEAHHYGYLIAGGFFGIHCVLLGVLIYKSNVFPKFFGGLLLGSGIGYLIETFGNFNFPGYETYTALIVGFTAAIGEVGITIYMLTKGATTSYKRLKKITE
ncbi:DUF4386 domain-containing protein [Aestuariibaculum sp. YM273]|uniref:DUF4386 domain-containing protein n=1 Tax=Aestuariibaculum sp. YM273 TaxID=3070659 RepID=UPI0027DB4036|nr:DUF4386 domain-containing protein [Aestuariibaculum sp. YM273]WMI64779.1 DUF4386 domain-containing protein [Aestuariibaculum sp. YM273]